MPSMPGMGTGLSADNSTVVSAFHSALVKEGLVVLVIVALVGLSWNVLRGMQLRRAGAGGSADLGSASDGRGPPGFGYPEPAGRRLLRISFGLIWIFDGVLQAQAAMPLGMTTQVIEPSAAASPLWVQHLLNAAATTWSFHPVTAASATVWIQIGIGVLLLAAPRGDWSRFAGLVSVGWGLIVWVFGEAFGGTLAPGLTLLFGAPGAVLFYCVAGGLVALPEHAWSTPRLGKVILRVMGVFLVGMAVVQAWPGQGFWEGLPARVAPSDTLHAMVQSMAQTPQPSFLSSWVAAFGSFDAAHGWAVNLFAVIVMAVVGAGFFSAGFFGAGSFGAGFLGGNRPKVLRAAMLAAVVFCLADWVLIEDLGFLGGIGTDPNSMIPLLLVMLGGYLAFTRVPALSVAPLEAAPALAAPAPAAPTLAAPAPAAPTLAAPAPAAPTLAAPALAAPEPKRPWRARLVANPTYAFRTVAAIGAVAITLVGAAPMAVAAIDPHAAPILAQAQGDNPTATKTTAPSFNLVNQKGQSVSLASLRGKVVALTFLDPVCVSDCPFIAQDFRIADGLLGADASKVEMVAIDANPLDITRGFLTAFDKQENLEHLSNWDYLTGSLSQLQAVWKAYGAVVEYAPGGAMVVHSEIAYVIDPSGVSRYILSTDPGAATEATQSSLAVNLAGAIESAIPLR